VVEIDPKYFRPTEVDLLIGDASKAKEKLGWSPKIELPELVQEMVNEDLRAFKRDQYLLEGGHDIMNFNE
jgi:GDPmannose 4,6-dehydratase